CQLQLTYQILSDQILAAYSHKGRCLKTHGHRRAYATAGLFRVSCAKHRNFDSPPRRSDRAMVCLQRFHFYLLLFLLVAYLPVHAQLALRDTDASVQLNDKQIILRIPITQPQSVAQQISISLKFVDINDKVRASSEVNTDLKPTQKEITA